MLTNIFAKFREKFDLGSTGRLMVCCVLVGLGAGLAGVLYLKAMSFVGEGVTQVYASAGIRWLQPDEISPPRSQGGTQPSVPKTDENRDNPFLSAETRTDSVFGGVFAFPRYWAITLLVPALGGLICGLLIYAFAPEGETEGTDSLIKTYHYRSGMMRLRNAPVKGLASLATIGTGGSAGWEGPMSLLGASAGTLLNRIWKLDARERRILLLAGVAGGIGAIFQTPFGGAIFAAEVLFCSTAIEYSVLLPCLIASLVGYSTLGFFCDLSRKIVLTQPFSYHPIFDIPWLLLFAVCCALLGLIFVHMQQIFRNRFFARMLLPDFLKPALGGLLLGCIALFLPQCRGGGYEYYQAVANGLFPLGLLVALLIGKMLATALTLTSGGCGGLLGPSLLIGGLFGGIFALLGQKLCGMLGIPELAPDLELYVLLGMGAFFAGIGKVPLTATILVCDMIGSYELMIPLLGLGLMQIAILSPRTTLFREQIPSFEDSPVHLGDFSVDLLRGISVEEVYQKGGDFPRITSGTGLSEMMRQVASGSVSVFPVVDSEGLLIGLLPAGDVRSVFQSHGPGKRLFAGDLAHFQGLSLTPGDDLETALRRSVRFGVNEIPVVDPLHPRKILGLLHKKDMIVVYHDRLASCAGAAESEI